MYRQLKQLGLDADLVFLDDNSPDGTGQMLDALARDDPRLTVIHRPGKLGIGSAHQAGIAWAYERGFDRLVTMDCDFTHNPADIPRFLDHARAGGRPVVVGSRYMNQDSLPGWNAKRRFLTHLGHFLTRRLLGIPQDASGAFRVYDLRKIPRWFWSGVQAPGYSFFFESMFLMVRNDLAIDELPIVLPARTYGHSKMSMREAVRSGMRILGLFCQTVIDPSRFRVVEPFTDLDPALNDPQHWEEYWAKKSKAGGVVYDAIATTYRNLVIKRRLNHFIRKYFHPRAGLLHTGCGSGQVDADLGREMSITALDISAPALQLYRKANPNAQALKHASIFALPFGDESFDGVYNLGLVEHFSVQDIRRILIETRRVLKKGGKTVIFWPHDAGTSVNVLRFVHWMLNDVMKKNVQLHPPEITHCLGRSWVEKTIAGCGLELVEYAFGPGDLWVQAVVVLRKAS
jgi:dolichol-phosphate mannosyltransferase